MAVRNILALALCASALLAILVQPVAAQDLQPTLSNTLLPDVKLRRIAEPDKRLKLTHTLLINPEAGIEASVLQTTHNFNDGVVFRFQPLTGNTERIPLPGTSGTWAASVLGDSIYIGGHMPGALYTMPVLGGAPTAISLPKADSSTFYFVWSTAGGSDGTVYLGTYPESALLRYAPATGQVTHLGEIVTAPPRERYLRHVNGRFPGKVYAGLGADVGLARFDLKTQKFKRLRPDIINGKGFVYYTDRFRDLLVVAVTPAQRLMFIDPHTEALVREIAPPEGTEGFWVHDDDNLVEYDGSLYFGTRPDDGLYRYIFDENRFERVAVGIGRPFGLAAGGLLFCRTHFGVFSIFDLKSRSVVLSRRMHFNGAGMAMHALANGAGEQIWGGTYINQGFFGYDAESDSLFAPGAAVVFGGQIDHLTWSREKVYIGHYTKARISVYDPKLPWRPGMQSTSNPRYLGAIKHQQDRIPAACTASDGSVYFGTQAEYGALGGALVRIAPNSDSLQVYPNLVPQQSIFALKPLPDGRVIGVTSVLGGLGAHPTAETSEIFVFDPAEPWNPERHAPLPGIREMWDFEVLDWPRILVGAGSLLYVYDMKSREIIHRRTAVPTKIKAITAAQNNWIYGHAEKTLFRVRPDLSVQQTITEKGDFWDSLVTTPSGRLFVGDGATLVEIVTDVAPQN